MPGHLGDERVTVQNLQVMQVREPEKIILISGAVPGANGSYVIVRPAIKNPGVRIAEHQAHRKDRSSHCGEEAGNNGSIRNERESSN